MARELHQSFCHKDLTVIMFKRIHWSHYVRFSLTCAILYSAAVFFFLLDTRYSRTWLLYTGNVLFLLTLITFVFVFIRKHGQNATALTTVAATQITSLLGIALSFLCCFILVLIMVPGLFHSGTPGKVLTGAPANTVEDKAHGLLFEIFGNAALGNFSMGFFVSIIFPFTLRGAASRESPGVNESEL
jgi:hypothetical protein